MPKKLTPTQRLELESLALKTLFVFDFNIREGLAFPGAEAFRKDIERARDNGNLRGMRMAWRDTCEAIDSMSPQQRAQLQALLHTELGVDLEIEQLEFEDMVNAIVARGVLKNEDEYRLVTSRLDQIADDAAAHKERDSLRKLIDDFEAEFPSVRLQ